MGAESADNCVLHRAGSKNQPTIISCFSPIGTSIDLTKKGVLHVSLCEPQVSTSERNLGKFLFARCPYTGGLIFPKGTKNQLCSKRAQ